MTRSEQGFSLNPMTRDEKTNTNTEKKALYRLEMRKEAPVIILTSFARSLTRNGEKFSCV